MTGLAPATVLQLAAAVPGGGAMPAWGLLGCCSACLHLANAAAAAGLVASLLGSRQKCLAAVRGHPLQAASEASGMHCQVQKLAGGARLGLHQAVVMWREAAASACAAMGAERALGWTHRAELA